MDTPYEYKNKKVGTPTIEVDRSFNPFSNEKTASRIPSSTPFSTVNIPKKNSDDWDSLYVGLESKMTFEYGRYLYDGV